LLRGFGAAEHCPLFSSGSCVDWKTIKEEMSMTRLSLIGVAAVAAATAFAMPAFAQHRVTHVANAYAQAGLGACGYQEPGNPYSKEEDYMAWSAWRARGGWRDGAPSIARRYVTCLSR
jgi:hypothetical protein